MMSLVARTLSWLRFPLAGFAGGLVLGWCALASAESLVPPGASAGVTVRIDGGGLDPESVAVAPGAHLVFRNEGAAMARVELDLARGEGIACAVPGDAPQRARKFVVPGGSTLDCDAPTEAIAYRVFQSGPGGRSAVREAAGRIELAP